MNYLLCGHIKVHKHGKMLNRHQRYFCPNCYQVFSESFESLSCRCHVSAGRIHQVLQAHGEGISLRHSRLKTVAARRAKLIDHCWSWQSILPSSTLI